jgi:hypothetical protein
MPIIGSVAMPTSMNDLNNSFIKHLISQIEYTEYKEYAESIGIL